jgi:hypothetical protein
MRECHLGRISSVTDSSPVIKRCHAQCDRQARRDKRHKMDELPLRHRGQARTDAYAGGRHRARLPGLEDELEARRNQESECAGVEAGERPGTAQNAHAP